jgi:peptidyl-prolyl cis-trans isomerase D
VYTQLKAKESLNTKWNQIKVNFAYVAGLYSTIKDVKITDAEIVDFMKKMKKNTKQRSLVK